VSSKCAFFQKRCEGTTFKLNIKNNITKNIAASVFFLIIDIIIGRFYVLLHNFTPQ